MEDKEQEVADNLLERAANWVIVENLGYGRIAITGVSNTNELCVGIFGDDMSAAEMFTAVRRGGGASGIINLDFAGEDDVTDDDEGGGE